MKKALLMANYCSGTGKAKTVLPDVIKTLSDADFLCTVYVTKCKSETIKTAESAVSDYDVIVAIGGDGTLSEIVNGVMKADGNVPIGYIPTGSTNDMAKSLGISSDPIEGAEVIAKFNPKSYDIGRFDGSFFTYIAATGAFTKVSYATSQSLKNSLGHLAYILAGVKSLSDVNKIHLSGFTDNGTFDGEYLFCSISNSTSVAGVIHMNEETVSFDDGLFELCLISAPRNLQDLMLLLGDIMASKFENKLIKLEHVSTVTINSPSNTGWTLDGEDGGKRTKIKFSVSEKKLLLLSDNK